MKECPHRELKDWTNCPNYALNCKNSQGSCCVFLKFDELCSYDKCFASYRRELIAEMFEQG